MSPLHPEVTLLAPGGVFLRERATLVIADLHAGYVDTLRHRGVALPPVGDDVLLSRVDALLTACDPARVIVAGDLVHGAAAAHQRRGEDSALEALLARFRGRALTVVPGNHDRGLREALERRGVAVDAHAVAGPHRVRHGDEDPETLRRLRAEVIAAQGLLLIGHHHPALSLRGGPGVAARVPAFAWCEGLLAIPALSPFARGADLRHGEHGSALLALGDDDVWEIAVVVGGSVARAGALGQREAAVSSRRGRRR